MEEFSIRSRRFYKIHKYSHLEKSLWLRAEENELYHSAARLSQGKLLQGVSTTH